MRHAVGGEAATAAALLCEQIGRSPHNSHLGMPSLHCRCPELHSQHLHSLSASSGAGCTKTANRQNPPAVQPQPTSHSRSSSSSKETGRSTLQPVTKAAAAAMAANTCWVTAAGCRSRWLSACCRDRPTRCCGSLKRAGRTGSTRTSPDAGW